MDGRKISVVVNLDMGNQLFVWTPDLNDKSLEDWLCGLSAEAIKNLWANPRDLPGRVEQIALARSEAPTHVLEIRAEDELLLVEMHEGLPERKTLISRKV
jgi:hypothetical protein